MQRKPLVSDASSAIGRRAVGEGGRVLECGAKFFLRRRAMQEQESCFGEHRVLEMQLEYEERGRHFRSRSTAPLSASCQA